MNIRASQLADLLILICGHLDDLDVTVSFSPEGMTANGIANDQMNGSILVPIDRLIRMHKVEDVGEVARLASGEILMAIRGRREDHVLMEHLAEATRGSFAR